MDKNESRFIQVGDWCFEVKAVRAYRVANNSNEYNAIANCHFNGDTMYVDGLLNFEGEDITKRDFLTFKKFCNHMGLEGFNYHRYHQGESANKSSDAEEQS